MYWYRTRRTRIAATAFWEYRFWRFSLSIWKFVVFHFDFSALSLYYKSMYFVVCIPELLAVRRQCVLICSEAHRVNRASSYQCVQSADTVAASLALWVYRPFFAPSIHSRFVRDLYLYYCASITVANTLRITLSRPAVYLSRPHPIWIVVLWRISPSCMAFKRRRWSYV